MFSRAEPARLGALLFPQAASFPELQLLAGPRGTRHGMARPWSSQNQGQLILWLSHGGCRDCRGCCREQELWLTKPHRNKHRAAPAAAQCSSSYPAGGRTSPAEQRDQRLQGLPWVWGRGRLCRGDVPGWHRGHGGSFAGEGKEHAGPLPGRACPSTLGPAVSVHGAAEKPWLQPPCVAADPKTTFPRSRHDDGGPDDS